MKKSQLYRYEMFVRIVGFGAAHKDMFPESSQGSNWFKQVTAMVDAIDQHMKTRVVARAEARRVKAETRSAVVDYMKTIARVAKRVMLNEPGENPFRMPRRGTIQTVIATARAFIAEASRRQEQFVQYGLPATAISEFETLVTTLDQAADTRQTSKTARQEAQANIEASLKKGLDVIRDLDAAVGVATRRDPVRQSAWRTARRIEGFPPPAPAKKDEPAKDEPPAKGADPELGLPKAS